MCRVTQLGAMAARRFQLPQQDEETGQGLVEYGLIIGLISGFCLGAIAVGHTISNLLRLLPGL